jgi:nucleotide-binding universal stress UspA family protein
MPDIRKILFALELSAISKEIVPWAETMHQKTGADLHVLHVVPGLTYYYAISPEDAPDEAALLRAAERKLDQFCQEHLGQDIQPRLKVTVGNPADEIIDYITSENISLVIIGTHGRRGLNRALFGSVADRVLRFCPVPVMVVNPCPPAPEG